MFYSLAPLSLSFFSFSFILSHHLFFSPCVCLCQHPYSVLTRSSPYCFLFCVCILLTVAFSSTFFFLCVCVFAFSLLLYISGFFFFSIPNPTHGQLSVVSFFFFFFLPLFKWLCLFLYVRFFFLAEERKSLFFFCTKANSS